MIPEKLTSLKFKNISSSLTIKIIMPGKIQDSSFSSRKLTFVIVLMIMLFSLHAISQTQNNIIYYNKGRVTDAHENSLDYGQLKYFMQGNDKALEHLHLSRAYLYVGTGASIIGLSSLYFLEAASIYEGPVFWTVFGVGCTLGITGLIIGNTASRRSLGKAVSIYNSTFHDKGTSYKYEFKFGMTPSGIGLALQF